MPKVNASATLAFTVRSASSSSLAKQKAGDDRLSHRRGRLPGAVVSYLRFFSFSLFSFNRVEAVVSLTQLRVRVI